MGYIIFLEQWSIVVIIKNVKIIVGIDEDELKCYEMILSVFIMIWTSLI